MEEGKVVAGVVVIGEGVEDDEGVKGVDEGVDNVVNPVGRIEVATVVDSGTVKAVVETEWVVVGELVLVLIGAEVGVVVYSVVEVVVGR